MSQQERLEKQKALNILVKIKLIRLGYNKEELALMLHMSLASLYNKLKEPDKFTYKELQFLRYKLEFSNEEFLQVI